MPPQKEPTRQEDRLLLEAILGTSTTPPAGMHLRPELRNPDVLADRLAKIKVRGLEPAPNIKLAWELAKESYPFVAANVKSLEVNPWQGMSGAVELPPTLLPSRPYLYHPKTLRFPSSYPYISVNPRKVEGRGLLEIVDLLAHELAHISTIQNFPTAKDFLRGAQLDRPWAERPHEQQGEAVREARRRLRGDVNLPAEAKR